MTHDSFELVLTDMAHGGSAIGRHQGRMIFVPYAIPGERVQVRLTHEKGRVAYAEGQTLLEVSADRVRPRCPHFGPRRCGRCQWQHIAYEAQLLLKQDVLADQLARIGGLDSAEVRPVIASPQQWGYNHHMTFSLLRGATDSDAPVFMLPAAVEGRLFPISECHILHPDLLALYDRLDLSSLPDVARITLQIGSDGRHMVVLHLTTDELPELLVELPTSVNVLLADNEPANLVGDTHSRYTVLGRSFRATAGAFIRPNAYQLDALVTAVLDALALTGSEAVLDLYAGGGLFGAFAAARSRLVTLVESYPPAATDADENTADWDNVDLIEGAVEDVLDALDERYDAAIADPPASGLSTAALDALVDQAPPRLVYVSSDPATLARDAKRLGDGGYRLLYVQPLDLAPQTYYIDAVAVFSR